MTREKWILIIGNALLVLAWPAGFLLASMNSEGVDRAGRGYAELFTLGLVLLATYVPVSIALILTGYRNWKHLSVFYKCLALTPGVIPAGILALIISIILS
jgi:hypothetical protein